MKILRLCFHIKYEITSRLKSSYEVEGNSSLSFCFLYDSLREHNIFSLEPRTKGKSREKNSSRRENRKIHFAREGKSESCQSAGRKSSLLLFFILCLQSDLTLQSYQSLYWRRARTIGYCVLCVARQEKRTVRL